MKKIALYFLTIYLVLCFYSIKAQRSDSLITTIKQDSLIAKRAVNKAIYGSARKATIMSAIFPGLGQAYNKKYSKIPIIYGALGGLVYWGSTNQIKYKFYSNNLKAIYDDNPNTINSSVYSSDQLISEKKYYKKYRDTAIMLGALVYVLNIIDANVDAHLKTFDISDDLSLQLKPYSAFDYNSNLQTGITLKLKFK